MNKKEEYVLKHYIITTTGNVYSTLKKKEPQKLSLRKDKNGYFDVPLVYNDKGDRMPFRVHRLVALNYIKNPDNLPIVNHLDLNKQNNNVENLRWSTVKINTQHGYDLTAYQNIKKIKVTEPNGNIHVFPSESHASRYYNYANPSTINHIVRGIKNNPIPRGKRKGLYFEYTNEGVTTIERNVSTVTNV